MRIFLSTCLLAVTSVPPNYFASAANNRDHRTLRHRRQVLEVKSSVFTTLHRDDENGSTLPKSRTLAKGKVKEGRKRSKSKCDTADDEWGGFRLCDYSMSMSMAPSSTSTPLTPVAPPSSVQSPVVTPRPIQAPLVPPRPIQVPAPASIGKSKKTRIPTTATPSAVAPATNQAPASPAAAPKAAQTAAPAAAPKAAPVAAPTTSGPTAAMVAPTTPPTPPAVAPANNQPPTTAPFKACKAVDRSKAITALIETVTPNVTSLDLSSPQGFALDWITKKDAAAVDPCTNPTAIEQRYALATLYSSTDGSAWTNQSGWLSASSECNWFGVFCNSAGRVVERLELQKNNLAGSFPDEMIRALPALQRLEFYANSVRGSIPTILNKLSNLNFLDVEQNKLTGPAFVDVTGLTKLSSYRVSLNELTGTIPENWWQMSTQRSAFPLTEFWFSDNKLIGTIPSSIGDYTQLTSLIMNSNNFQGSLPSELGKLNLLQEFLAYQNLLTSTIPNEFYKDTLLQVLQLQRNILTGTISGQIGDLKALQDLRLGENNFSGSFPPEIAKLSNLEILLVNGTNLKGVIRDSFEPFRNLRFVDLSKNLLTGPLPSSIFNSDAIEILYLSYNALTGTIPANYGNASKLHDLYLNDNKLTGMVPPVGPNQLQNLTEFLIENNLISGTMPASICALRGQNPAMDLFTLVADCGGVVPRIQCDCCSGCISHRR